MVNAKRDGQKQRVMKKRMQETFDERKKRECFSWGRFSFFWKKKDRKVIFRKNKIENATKKKDETKNGEEKLKGFQRKRWKEEMIKETEEKHEGFATITGREKFFFFLKEVFGNKKRRVTMRRVDKEREHQEDAQKGVETWTESADGKRNEKH